MVEVTRLNGRNTMINSDLIELIESTPDTIISLTTGRKIIVRDTVSELVQKLFDYKKALFNDHSYPVPNPDSVNLSKAV